jgi:CIC family chloride channel protein
MHPFSGAVLDASLTIAQAAQQTKGFTTDYALVHTTTAGWNLVKVAQLASWVAEGKDELTLHSVLPLRSLPYLHPDHPLEVALRYVDRWPIVPIVNRANFSQLEGVVSKQDVLARYQELAETD